MATDFLSIQKTDFVPLFKESSFYANATPLRDEKEEGTQVDLKQAIQYFPKKKKSNHSYLNKILEVIWSPWDLHIQVHETSENLNQNTSLSFSLPSLNKNMN